MVDMVDMAQLAEPLEDRAWGCGHIAIVSLGPEHKEGVLRAERITWTGHVRDTGVFSILKEEWQTRG